MVRISQVEWLDVIQNCHYVMGWVTWLRFTVGKVRLLTTSAQADSGSGHYSLFIGCQGQSNRDVKMTTQPHVVLGLKVSGTSSPLSILLEGIVINRRRHLVYVESLSALSAWRCINIHLTPHRKHTASLQKQTAQWHLQWRKYETSKYTV
jgi:hypothetical protein